MLHSPDVSLLLRPNRHPLGQRTSARDGQKGTGISDEVGAPKLPDIRTPQTHPSLLLFQADEPAPRLALLARTCLAPPFFLAAPLAALPRPPLAAGAVPGRARFFFRLFFLVAGNDDSVLRP